MASPGQQDILPDSFSARRYVEVPFPRYRFVPGRNPHPTAHPRGHSYRPPDSPPHAVTYYAPGNWQQSQDYLFGCDLYNHAYWWEAHEAWEGLWQLTDKAGIQGRFLQGLIQASACHLKRFCGHVRGVERLRRTSLEYLKAVVKGSPSALFMGLNVCSYTACLEAYYDACDARPVLASSHDSGTYPYVLLVVDRPRRDPGPSAY